MIHIDASDFVRLAADLEAAADGLMSEVRPVVAKGAVNVKGSMREAMGGSAHFGQVASSISYDLRGNAVMAEAEVGPETGGQVVGDLAHFAYFGAPNGGGGTVRDPQEDLDAEAPGFEAALNKVVEGLLR